jgi:hypothetical protein
LTNVTECILFKKSLLTSIADFEREIKSPEQDPKNLDVNEHLFDILESVDV